MRIAGAASNPATICPTSSTSMRLAKCASWEGSGHSGLIAPGVEMADVLLQLHQAKLHQPRVYKQPDEQHSSSCSAWTASFGDYFADHDGPRACLHGQTGAEEWRGEVQLGQDTDQRPAACAGQGPYL